MARLNVQGLARRDRGLMECILPESPDYQTVSIDLSAGEPTVTAHFSQDPNYRYATFDGVGKAPFWKDGVLMVDDIYLMTMSISPLGRERIEEAWRDSYDGLSFADAWLSNADLVKSRLKKERDFHKMGCLGWGYGMGARKFVKQAYDKGYILHEKHSTQFKNSYWELFSGVKRFADKLAIKIKRDGYIVSPFGYRLTPPPHKAFNYYIQNSVSGIMHIFNWKVFAIADYALFDTVVHDELLADVPTDRIEDFRRDKDLATASLNEDLKWTTSVRTGFAVGKNWYEAK